MSAQWLQGQIERLRKNAEETTSRFDWEAVHWCAQSILVLDYANKDFLETCRNHIGTLYLQGQSDGYVWPFPRCRSESSYLPGSAREESRNRLLRSY